MKHGIFALTLLFAPAAVAAETGPVEVVRETTDKLFSLIEEKRGHYEQHPEELECLVREILLPKLDQLYAGRLVLGRHARGEPPEKIEEFAQALSGMLIERYAEQLLQFKERDQMQVLPLSGDASEKQTRVQTRVKLLSGQSVPVDYVMHRTDEGWQVFDVVVEGVSYVVTFRTQLNEEIQRYGFDRVLDRIRKGEIKIEDDDR